MAQIASRKLTKGRVYSIPVAGDDANVLMAYLGYSHGSYAFVPLNEHVFMAEPDGTVRFLGCENLYVPTKEQLKSLALKGGRS